MKTKFLLLSFLAFCLGSNLHGQGLDPIVFAFPTPGTLVTDCETDQPVGPGYVAALYWGPGATTDRRNFTQVGSAMTIVNGRVFSGNRTITGVGIGTTISLYGAAWQSAFGPTYEVAAQVPGAKVGQSDIVTLVTSATTQVRIPDFQVCAVPEPSTIALSTLALAVWFLRRRSHKPVK